MEVPDHRLEAPIYYANAPEGFPRKLDFFAKDPISNKSFGSLYKVAKTSHAPSFVIGVVEYLPSSSSSLKNSQFKIYDGVALYKHLAQQKSYFSLTKKNGKILTVNYLALKCFAFEPTNLKRELSTEEIFFSNLPVNSEDNEVLGLVLDGVNYFFNDNEETQGKIQYIVADHLLSQADPDSQEEAMRWLWCSSTKGITEAEEKIQALFKSHTILNENSLFGVLSDFAGNPNQEALANSH